MADVELDLQARSRSRCGRPRGRRAFNDSAIQEMRGRRPIEITRVGASVTIQPAPPWLRRLANESESNSGNAATTGIEQPTPCRLLHGGAADVAVVPGGLLEPITRRLDLDNLPYRVTIVGDLDIQLPPPALVGAIGNPALINAVAVPEPLVVQYDDRLVDVGDLITAIARSWPETPMVIVERRVAEIVTRVRQLGERGIAANPVTYDGHGDPNCRIAVCTYGSLGALPIGEMMPPMVMFTDALALPFSKKKVAAPDRVATRRQIVFQKYSSRMTAKDIDHQLAWFGLRRLMLPAHGQTARQVQVRWQRICGGPTITAGGSHCRLKSEGLWHHPIRNRQVARIAREAIQSLRNHAELHFFGFGGRLFPPVQVVVENLEHARQLQHGLHDFPIVDRPFSEDDATTVGAPNLPWATPDYRLLPGAIVTHRGLSAAWIRATDILIRADGGVGMMPLPRSALVTGQSSRKPLKIVDFVDDHHSELRQYSKRRRSAYEADYWWNDDVHPIIAAADQFWRRKGGSS